MTSHTLEPELRRPAGVLIKALRRRLNTFDRSKTLGHWHSVQVSFQALHELLHPQKDDPAEAGSVGEERSAPTAG